MTNAIIFFIIIYFYKKTTIYRPSELAELMIKFINNLQR